MSGSAASSTDCDLPQSWPACLVPRQGVEKQEENEDLSLTVSRALEMSQPSRVWPLERVSLTLTNTWRALDPNTPGMRAYDVFGILVLAHDLLVTPYLLSWNLQVQGILLVLAWAAGLYWTIDLLVGFITGFYQNGELVLEPSNTCRHYLRTAFAPNLLLLFGDWMSLVEHTVQASSVSRVFEGTVVLRFFKTVRLLKVLRVSRLMQLMDKISTSALASSVRVALEVLKVICGTLFASHLLCCVWHVIGREGPSDTDTRWPADVEHFEDAGGLYQYLTALHFAVAQLTLGSSDVMPGNWFERLFNIVLLVTGLLFGSTIVAFASTQFVNLSMVKKEQKQVLASLRKFLRQHSVPTQLVMRVTRQAKERLSEERHLSEADVPALDLLSSSLRSELLFETRSPHVLSHPLFRIWGNLGTAALRQLCERAVGYVFLMRQDVLFQPKLLAEQAYHVVQGRCTYSQCPETSRVHSDTTRDVEPHTWVSEAALWCHWLHVGTLEAPAPCQVLCLRSAEFQEVLKVDGAIAFVTRLYGRNFYARLASAVPPHAPWPSDIHVPFNASELISRHTGLALLKRATRASLIPREQAKVLEAELKSGRCALQPATGSAGLERTVSLTLLRLQHEGSTLMQVGRQTQSNGLQVACLLPGTKRAVDEAPRAALERFLSTHFESLMPHIDLQGVEHSVVRNEWSSSSGVNTTYLHTVHTARLGVPPGEVRVPCTRRMDVQAELTELGNIPSRDVYCFPDGEGGVKYYCWLTEEECNGLSHTRQIAAWERWLEALDVREMRSI